MKKVSMDGEKRTDREDAFPDHRGDGERRTEEVDQMKIDGSLEMPNAELERDAPTT